MRAASARESVALTSDIMQVGLVLPAPHAAYRIVYVRAAHRTVDLLLDPPQRENWMRPSAAAASISETLFMSR